MECYLPGLLLPFEMDHILSVGYVSPRASYLLRWHILVYRVFISLMDFPDSSVDKRICLQCRRPWFSPWVGKTPWKRNGNPLQYSCLENFLHREAWWAIVHGVTKNRTQLSNSHFDFAPLSLGYTCPLHRGDHCVVNTGNSVSTVTSFLFSFSNCSPQKPKFCKYSLLDGQIYILLW